MKKIIGNLGKKIGYVSFCVLFTLITAIFAFLVLVLAFIWVPIVYIYAWLMIKRRDPLTLEALQYND